MNPELWQKPYDYSFEEQEVKTRLQKFVSNLTTAKRMMIDPFGDSVKIRCTTTGCKIRFSVNSNFIQQVEEGQPKDAFRFLAGVHEHFLQEINFNRIGLTAYTTICRNGKEFFICESCGYAPFPKPMGMRENWQHFCTDCTWGLNLGKPNIMTFRAGMWVLQINYVHRTWNWLNQTSGRASYDIKNSCWLIADSFADEVEKACKLRFPNFKRGQKPAGRPGNSGRPITGNLNIRKAQAAEVIVSIIAKTGAFRAVQAKIHPDRFLDETEKAEATKTFQALQEAWDKWEKS